MTGPNEKTPKARVTAFWQRVWNEGRLEEIDAFMTEDFVIHSGGKDIAPRTAFKAWVASFQENIDDLHFEIEDIMASDLRVTTRWRITGKNRGFMGTDDNHKPIDLTGITISRLTTDGIIAEKWVERSAWELHPKII